MKLQNMKTKELAEWLHNSYEENWETQKECRVEFEELPEKNKLVMISLARKIHKNIR